MTSVNGDNDFDTAPPCKLGDVLRDDFWLILFLRRKFDAMARIVLSKMDIKVGGYARRSLGNMFRDLVLVDRRLQFGWRSSPGFRCLFAAALDHGHVHPSYLDPIATPQGRRASQHAVVHHSDITSPAPRPRGRHVPPGRGIGVFCKI